MKNMTSYLQKNFINRCKNNPSYSLRSFAKFLNVSPSMLSDILYGKRIVTSRMRNKIGLAMGLCPEDISNFTCAEHGNKHNKKVIAKESTSKKKLALDSFYIISQWHHYALLQLIKIEGKNFSTQLAAKRLGLKSIDVEISLKRLLNIGVLIEGENMPFEDTTKGATTHLEDGFTNEALKRFQVEALKKAIESINQDPIEYRDNTSMTMAIDKKQVQYAKNKITEFRRNLTQELEQTETPDEVYQLLISFTPLTKL